MESNSSGTENTPIESMPPQPMELTVTLPIEQWNLLIEMMDLIPKPMLKIAAINIIKPQLNKQFEEKK